MVSFFWLYVGGLMNVCFWLGGGIKGGDNSFDFKVEVWVGRFKDSREVRNVANTVGLNDY